jgi:hypothetical protein
MVWAAFGLPELFLKVRLGRMGSFFNLVLRRGLLIACAEKNTLSKTRVGGKCRVSSK